MYLSRFGVKNYKCLGEIDIPLTPIHVLIGENDAGKTSLLEAMAAFYAGLKGLTSTAFPAPWTGKELVRHGSSENMVHVVGEWSRATENAPAEGPLTVGCGLEIQFGPRAGSNWNVIWAKSGTDEWDAARERRGGAPSEVRQRAQKARDTAERAYRDVTAQKYAFEAKRMALPAAPDLQRQFRLDPDGFGLPTLYQDIVLYEAERGVNLRDRFCTLFPQFKAIRIFREPVVGQSSPERPTPPGGEAIGIHLETKTGQLVRAQQASDGAILILGFLTLAHVPDPPTLLLIEEPENGIYPKRLGEVIKLLKQMVQRTEGVRFPQIIMSTHSPYVLSHFEPEEVTFLSRPRDDPNGPVRARPLRDAPNIKERLADGEFYLGELWYNLSEEDLFGAS